jgi:TrmH family RNA methyltransferase
MYMKIQLIQSRDNPKLKQLRALLNSNRARQQDDLTVLEGAHLCSAWLQRQLPVISAWVSETGQQDIEINAVLRQLPDRATVYILPDTLFQQVSSLETGAALCCIIEPKLQVIELVRPHDCVVLDAVQDPGNVGTILRTAAAAGVQEAWLGQGCASAWAPKTLRAGMGAHCVINITEGVSLPEILPTIDATTIAADVQAKHSLFDMNLRMPIAWIFGNEGQGLSEPVLSLVQARVFIPQSPVIESMNVAAAAAVSLFEMRRQRLFANKASN